MASKKFIGGASKKNTISAADFDSKFDAGEDISQYLDVSQASVVRRVNVDFPAWVIEALDKEAQRVGISRQAIIKVWVAERLDELKT